MAARGAFAVGSLVPGAFPAEERVGRCRIVGQREGYDGGSAGRQPAGGDGPGGRANGFVGPAGGQRFARLCPADCGAERGSSLARRQHAARQCGNGQRGAAQAGHRLAGKV